MLGYAVVMHSVADWLLQNDWMAVNKISLKHSAAYVHALIYYACMVVVFGMSMRGVAIACILAILHALIDTRKPVQWWMSHIKTTTSGDTVRTFVVAVAVDQTMHLALLGIAVLVMGEGA